MPVAVWLLHILLPLLGLWLLIAQPQFDLRWEDHPSHFWLVAAAAAVSFGLGARVNEQARIRSDARLFLVSLGFVVASGFLALHALSTPGVLLPTMNAAFMTAMPIGLFVAGVLAVVAAVEFSATWASRIIRRQVAIRGITAVLLATAAATTWNRAPSVSHHQAATEAYGPALAVLAAIGSGLFVVAGLRFYLIHRRRPAAILLSVITAFALLAEALIAIAYSRNWHASWWEWHLLVLLAFGFVAYSAHVEYRREGSWSGLFNGVALEQTLQELRREHAAALEALVEAIGAGSAGDRLEPVTARLAAEFGITERQAEILQQAATALARERDQLRRLRMLVEVGHQTRLGLTEEDLLAAATRLLPDAFDTNRIRMSMLRDGRLDVVGGEPISQDPAMKWLRDQAMDTLEPAESPDRRVLVIPLVVQRRAAGLLEVQRAAGAFSEQDRSLLRSLATQLSVAVENVRVHGQLDRLFHAYLAPDVARTLLADPAQAALGGHVGEVTVLMADLAGFTTFAEASEPGDVVGMLNAYYDQVVPCILRQGGTVTQFIGDAVMALFNAPVRQTGHGLRAARAALDLQRATQSIARPGWPRFRVGINTGRALVGNIGSQSMRHFTAVGDTINLAARLEAAAPLGGVLIGAGTYRLIADRARVTHLDPITVKGKAAPIRAHLLHALEDARRCYDHGRR
jgi:class 3 adenylate cyclase